MFVVANVIAYSQNKKEENHIYNPEDDETSEEQNNEESRKVWSDILTVVAEWRRTNESSIICHRLKSSEFKILLRFQHYADLTVLVSEQEKEREE